MPHSTQSPNHTSLPWLAYGLFDPKYDPCALYQTCSTKGSYLISDYQHQATGLGAGLNDILNQGKDLATYHIGLLEEELIQRRALKDANLADIMQDQNTLKNIIFLRGEDLWDKYRLHLEESIIGLETEKRRELSSYFRDVMWLGREKRQSLIEAREEDQKASWLQ